jgi:hypothetical protein
VEVVEAQVSPHLQRPVWEQLLERSYWTALDLDLVVVIDLDPGLVDDDAETVQTHMTAVVHPQEEVKTVTREARVSPIMPEKVLPLSDLGRQPAKLVVGETGTETLSTKKLMFIDPPGDELGQMMTMNQEAPAVLGMMDTMRETLGVYTTTHATQTLAQAMLAQREIAPANPTGRRGVLGIGILLKEGKTHQIRIV